MPTKLAQILIFGGVEDFIFMEEVPFRNLIPGRGRYLVEQAPDRMLPLTTTNVALFKSRVRYYLSYISL